MASSQHRCVFVGNIPYDATEEQLIEICREVGPVVSFRLVIDRETGKPKGYGFCEYKDEETALSARRNLQGYEINGRQLRVDFAENDKGTDRNREQGRGGPGMAATVDPQKQLGGPAIHGDAIHQPIGLQLAITASTVLSGALGGPQAGLQSSQNVIQNQLASANDPLTLHLAKMSRSQLTDIMSDLKIMATQNKESARQLLLAKPQLLKAIFQAQIMLGMVTPQVLQTPNLRQGPVHPAQPSLQDGQQGQQPVAQSSGLPPLAHKMHLAPKVQEGMAAPHNSLLHSQFSAPLQPTMHSQIQPQLQSSNQVLQQAALHGLSGVSTVPPSIHPSIRPQIQATYSSSLNQKMQHSSVENKGLVAAASMGLNARINLPNNVAVRSSLLPHPSSSDAGIQSGPSISSGLVPSVGKDVDRPTAVPTDASRSNTAYSKMPAGLAEKRSMVPNSSESVNRPSKMMRPDDRTKTSFPMGALNASPATVSGPPQTSGAGLASTNSVPKTVEVQPSDKQISQLPSDVESALLQQVMSLTPEQLTSLPPEQRQQVIQLQQALLQNQMQPS